MILCWHTSSNEIGRQCTKTLNTRITTDEYTSLVSKIIPDDIHTHINPNKSFIGAIVVICIRSIILKKCFLIRIPCSFTVTNDRCGHAFNAHWIVSRTSVQKYCMYSQLCCDFWRNLSAPSSMNRSEVMVREPISTPNSTTIHKVYPWLRSWLILGCLCVVGVFRLGYRRVFSWWIRLFLRAFQR